MTEAINLSVDKSEILFLYESTYSIPNGDPYTGEQRYDDETKRVLVSDVRIKRFIRDYFADTDSNSIYVINDRSAVEKDKEGSGAAARFDALAKGLPGIKPEALLKSLIDVRLFGGILTKEKTAINLTGPVQFALLNPSLNQVNLRVHQNTSVFASSTTKERGAIGTTTVVPYSLNQIHGWINPYSARNTGLQQVDIDKMFIALWESINNANTRTKSNQNSLLIVQLIYSKPTQKIYGMDRSIKLIPNAREEQIRSFPEDFSLKFAGLKEIAKDDRVKEIRYYTEQPQLTEQLKAVSILNSKFHALDLYGTKK